MRRSHLAALTVVVATAGLASHAQAQTQVLVLPFADASGGSGARWMETSIQRSLAGDVSRADAFSAVAAPSTGSASNDLASAISAAQAANAPLVVFGSYERHGDELRLVANAVDVERMKLVGGVRVARKARDIFGASDALGSYVVDQLKSARGGNGAKSYTPTNSVSTPLTFMPMGYGRLSGQAELMGRPSNAIGAPLLPQTMVIDDPAYTNQLASAGHTMGSSAGNQMTRSDGNYINKGDGNQITGGDGNSITGGDGNSIQRGDGNSMSMNRDADLRGNRQFGNTMGFNPGDSSSSRANARGASGNAVGSQTGGAIRQPSAGSMRPTAGNAVGGAGRAVTPGSGNAVGPQNTR